MQEIYKRFVMLRVGYIAILVFGLLSFSGCDSTREYDEPIDDDIKEEVIATSESNETIEYINSLPTNDMNSPSYELPKDPGNAGDETLLGIDSNENGIRDDVEIYIYNKFKDDKHKRVAWSIFSQDAKVTQKILQNPENALSITKLVSKVLACSEYWIDKKTDLKNNRNYYYEFDDNYTLVNNVIKSKIYNTRERQKAYFEYQKNLSGNILSLGKREINSCDQNITLLDVL